MHLCAMDFIPFRRLPLVFVCVLLAAVASAQDSGALLSRLSNKAKSYGSTDARYASVLTDKASKFTANQAGRIRITGSKFFLELGDYTVISNGTQVWTYEKATNDCMIDDMASLNEEGINPAKLFTIWEDDFRHEWKGRTTVAGRSVAVIHLYPKKANSRPFHTIQLYIDEAKLEIVRAVVKGREGTDVQYDVKEFRTGVTLDPKLFTFDKARYPGVKVVDNRL